MAAFASFFLPPLLLLLRASPFSKTAPEECLELQLLEFGGRGSSVGAAAPSSTAAACSAWPAASTAAESKKVVSASDTSARTSTPRAAGEGRWTATAERSQAA